MGVILQETGTKVKVNVDTSNIDKCINNIDSSIFTPVIEVLNEKKSILEKDVADEVADRVATRIRSYQEDIIYMNGTVDTTQMVSTIFIEPSSHGESEVGATALSERGFPYPIVIEYGSSKFEGKAFVQPSLNMIQGDLEKIGLEVVESKLR